MTMAGPASRTTTEASLSGAVVSPVTPVSAAESAPSARGRANLSLLGGFRLEVGGEIALLQPGGQRLLALLAIHGPLSRERAARVLWPDAGELHGRMRTALWRLRASGMVRTVGQRLVLADSVSIDLRRWADAAHRLTESYRAEPADFELLVTGPG
jgi:hypothetical protein